MNVNNCYFNSESPRWPKIALREAEAECNHNVIIVNSKCGQECDPRERGNALGIRQMLNSFYFIERAFYSHEPDTPHDSSDDANSTPSTLPFPQKLLKFQVPQTRRRYV